MINNDDHFVDLFIAIILACIVCALAIVRYAP